MKDESKADGSVVNEEGVEEEKVEKGEVDKSDEKKEVEESDSSIVMEEGFKESQLLELKSVGRAADEGESVEVSVGE